MLCGDVSAAGETSPALPSPLPRTSHFISLNLESPLLYNGEPLSLLGPGTCVQPRLRWRSVVFAGSWPDCDTGVNWGRSVDAHAAIAEAPILPTKEVYKYKEEAKDLCELYLITEGRCRCHGGILEGEWKGTSLSSHDGSEWREGEVMT